MSRILNIAWKDTLLRFASPSELLFFLFLPVLFILIVSGFATGQGSGDNRIVVLVVNEDGGALSTNLVHTLETSKSVRPEVLTADQAAKTFDDRLRDRTARRPALGAGATGHAVQCQLPGRRASDPSRGGPGQPGAGGGERQRDCG